VAKVLQTGTYSALNKGDATLQSVTARLLTGRIPEVQIVIACPFPQADADFYQPFQVVATRRRNLLVGTWLLMRALLWRWLRARGVEWRWLPAAAELRAMHDSDLVIDISGDMLTEDYGPHVAYSHFLPIATALAMGKRVMLFAQTIGPFHLTRPMARHLLKRVAAITVRDEITRDYLTELRLQRNDIQVTADVAFALEAAPRARAEEVLNREQINLHAPLLGVTVSRLIERKFWRSKRGPASGRNFVDFFAELLDEAADRLGMRVLFVPHVLGPDARADDRVLSAEIGKRMHSTPFLLRGDYRPEEVKAVVACCRLFLGARMHANIAALTSGVPTVAISYSHKTPGVLGQLGVGEFICHLEELTPQRIIYLLTQAETRREEIIRRVGERLPDMRQRAIRNADVAAELLESLRPASSPRELTKA
jgi:colanic acid/amylovoran biosynthesis protein